MLLLLLLHWGCSCMNTVFTLLNAMTFITLVPKIDAVTIQTRLPLDSRERCLSHYFHNWLWDHLSAMTVKGVVFNQVNAVLLLLLAAAAAPAAAAIALRVLLEYCCCCCCCCYCTEGAACAAWVLLLLLLLHSECCCVNVIAAARMLLLLLLH